MLELVKGARLIVETCARIKPGDRVLVVADDEAFPTRMGGVVADVANSAGAEAVLMVAKPREASGGQEPPAAVAAAMKTVNAVFYISNRYGIAHTNARKEASALGVRVYHMTQVPEDYFKREITAADIEQIKERTVRLADRLTKARSARVTTPAGTDITLGLEGRQGMGIHPLGEVLAGVPDYAEAAIAPAEGTSAGVMVIDVGMVGWGQVFRQPVRCVVKAGRVTEVSGGEDADRLRKSLATDDNAPNIAELGIGTSHTIPRVYGATRRDAGVAGMVHIAVGRNNDIGGQTWSRVHADGLMTRATIDLDGQTVVRDGVLV